MTEEEKKRFRALKIACTARLSPLWRNGKARRFKALTATDRRISDYITSVVDNPDAHNLYEILGIERFLTLFGKYEWRPKRVQHFFRFYESLRFSGISGRRRYKLTPVQAFQFASIYGFALPDGIRLVRTASLFVPRKFSKTTSSAAMAVFSCQPRENHIQGWGKG